MKLLLMLAAIGLAVATVECARPQMVVCYFTSWAVYRNGKGMYNVSNIPPDLCTHVYYGFVGLNEDGTVDVLDDWELNGLHEMRHLTNLRKHNPNLKILVSMGGWNEGSEKYSNVAADPALRQAMVNSVIQFLEKTKTDGFDLDWEYPDQRGGQPEDVENFITLLGELNQALKAHPKQYLLSIAVSGGVASADTSIDYGKIPEVVDYINVMAYDYHGDWEPYTGHYAPLEASHLDIDDNATLNIKSGFGHWIEKGVPPSKLNLGIGTYGRAFSLQDPTQQGLYAPTNGPGNQGPYTEESGTLGFNEICEFYPNADVIQDPEQLVPHMVVDTNQWIGYDDIASVSRKSKYARDVGAAGVMVWSLDTDDFLNTCGYGPYPLINAMKTAWNEE